MRRSAWRRFLRPAKHDWTLVFIHVPKTAGSSLRDAVAELYPPSARLYLYHPWGLKGAIDPKEFPQLPVELRARVRFVAGHIFYGLHQDLPRPARYTTIVREPVDRAASLYHHYRRLASLGADTPAADEGRRIIDGDASLEDWAFGQERIEVDNETVRRLSGRSAPFGHCPDDMLTEAMERVDESFAQVLIFEQLSRSTELLSTTLRAPIPRLRHQNVNRQRATLDGTDPAVRVRLRELNRLDAAFHQAMVERLG
jgi:hypothetical protein